MFGYEFVVRHLVIQGFWVSGCQGGFQLGKIVLSLSLMSVYSSSEFEVSMEDTLELSSSLFLETIVSFFPFFGVRLRFLVQTGFVGFFLPKGKSA